MTLKVVTSLNRYDDRHYWFPTYPQGFERSIGLSFADDNTFQDWADDHYPGWEQHVSLTGVVPNHVELPVYTLS